MEKVKLKVPEGAGNVSFEGKEYAVAKDGSIEVPVGAVAYLVQYGYEPVPAEGGKSSGGKQNAAKGREAPADAQ